MNAIAIANAVIAIIGAAAQAAPIAIKGFDDAKTFAVALWKSVTGEEPSAEDEAKIDQLLKELTSRLEEPLPPAQPGDPDYESGNS